ncbi:hypothetical protein Lalb_Chr08g0246041 [Lupinus albus]|uniref:Transmembrane protein n=1 Tax=Lupinus albus TaxID=3870 RepID=A0A6A4Q7D5_LUPAL|nr:hypothetical protein Lalb_Chr08g0246041 [Lupinus albus]
MRFAVAREEIAVSFHSFINNANLKFEQVHMPCSLLHFDLSHSHEKEGKFRSRLNFVFCFGSCVVMEETSSIMLPTQRYAAAGVFALALHHSQMHYHQPSTHDNNELWIHDDCGLLYPVFRFLGLDDQACHGLRKTAASSSQFRHSLESFLKLLAEEDTNCSERLDKEAALTKAVDATSVSLNTAADSSEAESGEHHQTAKIREDSCDIGIKSSSVAADETTESSALLTPEPEKQASTALGNANFQQPLEEASLIRYPRKVTVLYTLLSACVADTTEVVDKKCCQSRQGYDARYRVALRLLALWFGIKWNEMEAMEAMVAFSLMDSVSKEVPKENDSVGSETNWDKWKRGGIIGAAAVTGGTLMAVTGGLAAPAIAHGLGALAPVLGGIVPAIGGGVAAAATATGSAVGSVAVAASFGGGEHFVCVCV